MGLQALRWAAFAAALSMLVVYFQGGTTLVRDVRKTVAVEGNYAYLVLSFIMGIAGLSILVLQFLICAGGIEPVAGFPDGLVLAGAVLEIAGILAAYFVRGRYLGRFWSGSVEIQPDHHIVEHGPYRFIRHPVYALTLLIYPGVALAFPVGWVWLACGIMLAGYLLLTEYEDRFLARNLPGYAGYRARTRWKILPGIW